VMSARRHVADMSADTTLSAENCRHRHPTCAAKMLTDIHLLMITLLNQVTKILPISA
jgi:hypothetical protein